VKSASPRRDVRPAGKPDVAGIHFNVAHAGDLIRIAVHGHQPLGVAVERATADADRAMLAPVCFGVRERRLLLQPASLVRPSSGCGREGRHG
jgi:phosphopantetheinyl transferase